MAGHFLGPTEAGRLARYGPFFALTSLGGSTGSVADIGAPVEGWHPITALASDHSLLTARTGAVRTSLETLSPVEPQVEPAVESRKEVEQRVVLSVTHLGLAARLTAVALASAVNGCPVPGPDHLVFRNELGGPFPLALTHPVVELDTDLDAQPWPESVLALTGPVTTAMVGRGLPPPVAWGNVASALAGAAAMIAAVEPAAADRSAALLAAALAGADLAGTGELIAHGFRRRNCCLIYRLPSRPGYCGDCVLAR